MINTVKKKIKKISGILLSAAMLLTSVPVMGATSYTVAKTQIGTTGVYWEITSDGVLEITGSGNPGTFNVASQVPWYTYMDQIHNVTMSTTVKPTDMSYWFYNAWKMSVISIVIPESVQKCDYTFYGCSAMEGSVTILGDLISYSMMFTNSRAMYGSSNFVLGYGGYCPESTINKIATTWMNIEPVLRGYPIGSTDCYWSITKDGTLMIAGEGNPGTFNSYSNVPWYSEREKIKASSIGSGVIITNMDYWFQDCVNMVEAPIIPEGVNSCAYTFSGCSSLTGNICIMSELSGYESMLSGTKPVTVYYGGKCTKELAEKIVESSGNNVTLGGSAYPDVTTEDIFVVVGESAPLPYEGYAKGMTCVSSDETIATVDSKTEKVTGVKSGTATITATFTNCDNTKTTAEYKVTVANIAPGITSQPKPVVAALDEEAVFEVTADGTNNVYQWYMTDNINTEEGIMDGTAIEGATADTYTIPAGSLSLDLNDKYFYCTISNEGNEPVSTIPVQLSVISASGGKLIVTAEDYSGIYDGKKHSPYISCEGATIRYGMKEGVYDSDTIPEFTIAGKYTVYYEVSMEGYDTVTGSTSVTLTHSGDVAGVMIDDWVYGQEASELIITSNLYDVEDAIITWTERGMDDYSFEKPSVPGEYTVNVTFIDTASGEGMDLQYNFTILKGRLNVFTEDYTGTYNGQENYAVLNCEEDNAEIKYGLSPDSMDLTEMPSFTNVGEYTVYYEVTGDYYEPAAGSLKVVITKAEGTGTLEIMDVLCGEEIVPVITSETNPVSDVIYYKPEDAGDDAYTTETPTEPGTYTAKVILAGNENYKETVLVDTFRIMEEYLPENTEIAPNAPEAAMTVSYNEKTVRDVSLEKYPYWTWQNENEALEVNVPHKAVAVYTGMDARYYETTAVEVVITRMECSHPENSLLIFEGNPATCVKNGYSDYAICADCNMQVIEKTAVNATGHKWNSGEVTKEASASADGSKLFTCTVCGNTKTEAIKYISAQTPAPAQNVLHAGDVVTAGAANYKVAAGNTFIYTGSTQKSKTSITIPDSVTYKGTSYKVTAVADNAFKNNKKLKKVIIGKNIVSIGKNAFYGCTKLTTVTMKSKVLTTISDNAFSGCKKLKSFTIPEKVKKIGKKAFYNCKNLKKITINSKKLTKKSIGKSAFKGIAKTSKIKVPKNKVKAYLKTYRM